MNAAGNLKEAGTKLAGNLRPMALSTWRDDAAVGKASSDVLLSKTLGLDEIQKLEDGPDGLRRTRFSISMDSPDRDNDTINVAGWRLDNYRKNPQVLWSHDYAGTPVPMAGGCGLTMLGLSPAIYVDERARLVSDVEWQPKELNPFADTIRQLVEHERRWIRAASVGFSPWRWLFNQERGGVDFDEQELLEWSICPIGSHPDALQEAKSLGIDLKPLAQWAESVLDSYEDGGLWVPKAQLETVYKISAGASTISIPALAVPDQLAPEALSTGTCKILSGDGTVLREFPLDPEPPQPETCFDDMVDAFVAELKSGRVLSRVNEDRLRSAAGAINDVLAQLNAQPEGDESSNGNGNGATVLQVESVDPSHFEAFLKSERGQDLLRSLLPSSPTIPEVPEVPPVLTPDQVRGLVRDAVVTFAKQTKAERDQFVLKHFGRLPD